MIDFAIPLQAAIRVEKDRPVDDIFEAVAELLMAKGLVVAGFLQRECTDGACCGRIELEDLAGGERHLISQALGPGARGCRLDPQALANVAGRLLSGLENDPDLLILNRFGKGEAEGQGFRAVMEEACALDIPVLIAVRESYVEAWERFAGDLGLLLPPDRGPVLDWVRRAVAAAGRLRDAA